MAQKDMDQRINSNSFGGEILGHFTFLFFFFSVVFVLKISLVW